MGHHVFEFHDRALRMHDVDVALVRHFLELGAVRLGNEILVRGLRKWEWPGPGVWLNVEENELAAHPEVFATAESVLEEFGKVVSAQYVKENVQDLSGERGHSAELIRDEIRKLRALIQAGT
jgi:hypothetical protein